MQRHLVLPARGRALVSTDLHGNLDDFTALRARFLTWLAQEPDTHWILAGDLVHGPDDASRGHALYGYEDASARLVREVTALVAAHPARVHVLLGNHDHGHVGGPHTSKFHLDEVEALELSMGAADKRALCTLFERALLAVALPCGALVCHGSPDDRLERLEDLDALSLDPARNDPYQAHVLASLLRSYGQTEARTARLLARLSAHLPFELTFVAHGHDKDEDGVFFEGRNQVCPVLFGARREARRHLLLDLEARYADAMALREGHEVLRVHTGDRRAST
ncbi:MAG: metallophosphoesterase [Myxococcales bacterium]|nr:metallophosphoesterase [Myxococcales bacterium]